MTINYQDVDGKKYEFIFRSTLCHIHVTDLDGLGAGVVVPYQTLMSRGHWILSESAQKYIQKVYKNKAFI